MRTRRHGLPRGSLLAATVAVFAALAGASSASAAAPHWQVTTTAVPTYLQPGSVGKVVLFVANHGDAPTSGTVTIADTLPAGLEVLPKGVKGFLSYKFDEESAMTCPEGTTTCHSAIPIQPAHGFKMILEVHVSAAAGTTLENQVTVSGGGAEPETLVGGPEPLRVENGVAPFGIERYGFKPEEENGEPDARAGSHPFQLSTNITINSNAAEQPTALPKELSFDLPPGLIGNPVALPKCSDADFSAIGFGSVNQCPANTAIGYAELTVFETKGFKLTAGTESVPLFLIEPAPGEPARLGFVAVDVPVIVDTSVLTAKATASSPRPARPASSPACSGRG